MAAEEAAAERRRIRGKEKKEESGLSRKGGERGERDDVLAPPADLLFRTVNAH